MVRPHSRFLVRLEMTGRMRLAETEKSENFDFVFGFFFFCGHHRLRMRRRRRDLEENGEFFHHSLEGRRRAEMVLVPFAETKGTRRVGTKPPL